MKYLLWLVLAIPAIGMMAAYFTGEKLAGELLHPTGEFSARFMIIAMLATPLLILFRQVGWSLSIPQWLVRNRRYFGVEKPEAEVETETNSEAETNSDSETKSET